ncbi:MAG: energy-coupling factor transporter transmembrane protein EcfT [Candidatus Eisenbacteria bacterium]|nr:energy-coupling factor transporter transmembrane protein EcfT [Candidatus Eisenbacteria bacterium]
MSFLDDMTLGRYYASGSVVHRLDPRVKLLGLLVVLAAALVTRDPWAYAFLTAALLSVARLSRLPGSYIPRNVWALKWLLVVVLVMHALLAEGTPLASWAPWLSVEGLTTGAVFAWRVGLMVASATLLTATTTPVDLGDGLETSLGSLSRIGIPVHELVMISVIALRFVPTLLDEARRIMKAQMGRGVEFSGGPVARARSAVPVLVPLFTGAFRRADDLALAMEARCYRGAEGRTKYRELRLGHADAAALLLTGGILACTIAISSWS